MSWTLCSEALLCKLEQSSLVVHRVGAGQVAGERRSSEELVEILNRITGETEPEVDVAADGAAVPVASPVSDYAARLTTATHPESDMAPDVVQKYVRYGSSPRGAQALILGGKVMALLAGRCNVAFEDLRTIAPAALRHRILLNSDVQTEDVSTDDVIAEVVKVVAEP